MSAVQPGQEISAKAWNELPQEIQREMLDRCFVATPPLYINNLGDRLSFSYIGAKPPLPAAASFTAIPQGGASGAAVIWVPKGSINDFADGTGLTVLGTAGTPPDNYWEFHVSPGATRYLYADVTINTSGTVTAAKLQLGASPPTTGAGNPTTGAPPAHAYRKLWKAVVDNDYNAVITQYVTGAQQALVVVSDWSCATITKNILWQSN